MGVDRESEREQQQYGGRASTYPELHQLISDVGRTLHRRLQQVRGLQAAAVVHGACGERQRAGDAAAALEAVWGLPGSRWRYLC